MKTKILFLFFALAAIAAAAQTNYTDVVYLKNGSIIHGIIIEQVPNQSLKIKTSDENVFFYKMDEIEKITHEERRASRHGSWSYDIKDTKQTGFINITELNFGLGLEGNYNQGLFENSNDDFSTGMQTIAAYLVSPNFSAGAGIGFDKYNGSAMIPIFADFRIYFSRTAATPYFSGAIGHSLGFENNEGGTLINPALGIRIFVSPKTAIHFSIGYRSQENSYKYTPYNYYYYPAPYTTHVVRGFFNFKTGVTF